MRESPTGNPHSEGFLPPGSFGTRWGALSARVTDFAMCAAMNAVQWRHRLDHHGAAAFQEYIERCERLSPDEYFAFAPIAPSAPFPANEPGLLAWESPVVTPYRENNRVRVDLYPCSAGWSAPTVLMLHALMSANDLGYRGWARRLNQRGWNACFIHLPYHYSRRPGGYRNGELAITADLVRTGEGLRQGVIELRQLMALLRTKGCREFGLWATSYGGWIGALLAFLESDFRFLGLMAPIVNVKHAIWESPAAWRVRTELRRAGIVHEWVARHAHLTSPMHRVPPNADRAVLIAGCWDTISLQQDLATLHRAWPGSRLITVPQGHFGYRMMPALFAATVGAAA